MTTETFRPTICLDFDGVIHQYDSGWKGDTVIPDDVTPGFFEWLDEASQHFDLVVYSSRSKNPDAVTAMQMWLASQRKKWRDNGGVSPVKDGRCVTLTFASEKPAAWLTIDDRGMTFTGKWSDFSPERLKSFRPWNKRQ